jgi:hypothetical protein
METNIREKAAWLSLGRQQSLGLHPRTYIVIATGQLFQIKTKISTRINYPIRPSQMKPYKCSNYFGSTLQILPNWICWPAYVYSSPKAGIHMTVAGTIAYKFLAHATYIHVYTLTSMPVSATQVDSTTFDLLACNLKEGTWGATNFFDTYCLVNWLV